MHKRKLSLPKVICRESKGEKKSFPPFYSARASFQSPCAYWFFSPTARPKHRHTRWPTAPKNGLFDPDSRTCSGVYGVERSRSWVCWCRACRLRTHGSYSGGERGCMVVLKMVVG
ncbi:hypothetical protein ES332_A09G109800v1 [Gossypium tomentosum]|uniref:Uncharacterized protein n=1 Tax=Gossypium tomentosum TaxID=34277 RepID=A0A5D2P5X8_GOSTO|nr:hypothetical protein ES332_A09G109800v1 [Gossypium tomentosum]